MTSIYQTILQENINRLKPSLLSEFKRLKLSEEYQKDSYAFLIFSMMSVLDIGLNEAILCSTEGIGDRGIDGIYIDTSGKEIQIYIFQAKYRQNLSKGIDEKEINLTLAEIKKIFKGEKFINCSPRIKAKIEEIQDTIKEFGSIKMPFINIYFTTNGKLPSENEKEEVKKLEKEGYYRVDFYSTEEIFNFISEKRKKDYEVQIVTKGDIIEQNLGNIKGIVATISAGELLEIYNKAGRDGVLEKNIRYYLGNNKINKKIEATAESENEASYFWFLNNGISIVCDYQEFGPDAQGNKIIKLKNPTIVNGGQTTKTLFKLNNKQGSVFSSKTIEKVFILVRIYETQDEEIIQRITEGTNRQNPIYIRDIKANNEVQNLVKQYFKDEGIYLETKRNEYREEKVSYDKIAKNDTILQSYLSLYKNIPHQAKSSKGGVFEEYFNNIFVLEDKNLPQEFFRSYELLKFTQLKERQAKITNENAFLPHAAFAIVYVMGMANENIKDISHDISQSDLEKTYSQAIEIIKKSIKDEKGHMEDAYSHNKFFKSSSLLALTKKYTKRQVN